MVHKYRRTLIAFLGFSITLMLNIMNVLSQILTAIACYMFLTVLLIGKFGVIPKQHYRLLNRW